MASRSLFFFLALAAFVPGIKLLLRNFSSLDSDEAPLVLPAVRLKDLVTPVALCPLLDGGGTSAELPGYTGAAGHLR